MGKFGGLQITLNHTATLYFVPTFVLEIDCILSAPFRHVLQAIEYNNVGTGQNV